jgi:hypothetical protein
MAPDLEFLPEPVQGQQVLRAEAVSQSVVVQAAVGGAEQERVPAGPRHEPGA